MELPIKRLARALEACYGLRIGRAERIAYGIWEQPFSVWTDQGRLFAKRFRRVRSLETMQRGLVLSQTLRAEGFPAPQVIEPLPGFGIPGAELVVLHEGERYILTEWVEGRTYHPGELPLACAQSMGALLGRFHRRPGRGGEEPWRYRPPAEALALVTGLLERYKGESAPFADVARTVLTEQVDLLSALPSNFHELLPVPRIQGVRFNSFWVEQLLFHPDGSVAALVDWTDGAGGRGYLVGDICLGIHLSALDRESTTAYVAGYQAENPLPRSEWEALAAELTYGHLASVNFLGNWLDIPMRRMPERDATTALWHRAVPTRFREREQWLIAVLTGAGF